MRSCAFSPFRGVSPLLPDQLLNSGWTADKWDQLEARARDVVEKHARLRHVIPRGPEMPGVYVVPELKQEPKEPLSVSIISATSPQKVCVDFVIESDQVGDENLIERLVDRASRTLAVREDRAIYLGNHPTDDEKTKGQRLHDGLVDKGVSTPGDTVLGVIHQALLQLSGNEIPYSSPYLLVAEATFWERIVIPSSDRSRGLANIIEEYLGADSALIPLTGERQTAPECPAARAVLVALDPYAVDLVIVESPTITLKGISARGLQLSLQERFKLRITDVNAIRVLQLTS